MENVYVSAEILYFCLADMDSILRATSQLFEIHAAYFLVKYYVSYHNQDTCFFLENILR